MPKSLRAVHPKYGSPYKAALLVYIIAVAVSLGFGLAFGPYIGGLLMLVANAYAAYLEHILASIGLPFFARKNKVFNIFTHLILPIIAIAILLAVLASTVYPSVPAYPFNIAVYIGIAWIGISGLLTFLEFRVHPSSVNNAGQFSIGDK